MKLTLHKGIRDGNGFSEPGKFSHINSEACMHIIKENITMKVNIKFIIC
jgi:hypothetical protein